MGIRVLYSFPHPLGKPGIGTTADAQVRGLIALGAEVSLYCTSLTSPLPGARRIEETMVVDGRRIPHRAIGIDRAYRYHDWQTSRALIRLAGEIDVVHCWPLAARRTLSTAKALGIPSFREVPNTHTEHAYARVARETEQLGMTLPRHHSHRPDARRLHVERREYALADRLLVPSDTVRDTFLERGYGAAKLVRHQYGFDPLRFPAPRCGERSHAAGLTAVFAGHGEPRKGLHHALDAWLASGAARRGRLLICGSVLREYRRLLARHLADPSVEELGFVGDIGSILRRADVLLLPSVEEGSALITYEAQASGAVPVVSDAAGALCSHPDQGLVHPAGDVATLAEHLRLLDSDRQLLARLKAVALARREELSWEHAARRLNAAYVEGLGAR